MIYVHVVLLSRGGYLKTWLKEHANLCGNRFLYKDLFVVRVCQKRKYHVLLSVRRAFNILREQISVQFKLTSLCLLYSNTDCYTLVPGVVVL